MRTRNWQFTFIFGLIAFTCTAANSLAADKDAATKADEPITFNKHVAKIVFQNCSTCHREGEVAPFSLLTYDDVQKRAEQIQQVTSDRFMPPWKSVEGYGHFIGERRLSPEEISTISQWVEQGAVEGDPADLPAAPQFSNDWTLGEPDLVITMPEAFTVPADGDDIYQNFVLPFQVPEGKYVKAIEYRPGNRRVVHHATLSMEMSHESRKKDEADPQPGFRGSLNIPGRLLPGSTGIWTPGREARPLPEGLSLPWPEGADLVLQLHLHPSGKVETEQSSIAFYLTDEAPQRSTIDLALVDRNIDISAGDSGYRTRDEATLPVATRVLCIFPHMHLIGRAIKVTANPPSGDPVQLLWINDWDFNWQSFYQYAEPIELPAGTRIVMEAVHDNSADNIRNPSNPPKRVTWGEQTTNEMSVAILQLAPVNEDDLSTVYEKFGPRILGGITAEDVKAKAKASQVAAVLKIFDKDKDGKITVDELAKVTGAPRDQIEKRVKPFDKDGDGFLISDEILVAMEALRGG